MFPMWDYDPYIEILDSRELICWSVGALGAEKPYFMLLQPHSAIIFM